MFFSRDNKDNTQYHDRHQNEGEMQVGIETAGAVSNHTIHLTHIGITADVHANACSKDFSHGINKPNRNRSFDHEDANSRSF